MIGVRQVAVSTMLWSYSGGVLEIEQARLSGQKRSVIARISVVSSVF